MKVFDMEYGGNVDLPPNQIVYQADIEYDPETDEYGKISAIPIKVKDVKKDVGIFLYPKDAIRDAEQWLHAPNPGKGNPMSSKKYIFPKTMKFPVYDKAHERKAYAYALAGRIAEDQIIPVFEYLANEAKDKDVKAKATKAIKAWNAKKGGDIAKVKKVLEGKYRKNPYDPDLLPSDVLRLRGFDEPEQEVSKEWKEYAASIPKPEGFTTKKSGKYYNVFHYGKKVGSAKKSHSPTGWDVEIYGNWTSPPGQVNLLSWAIIKAKSAKEKEKYSAILAVVNEAVEEDIFAPYSKNPLAYEDLAQEVSQTGELVKEIPGKVDIYVYKVKGYPYKYAAVAVFPSGVEMVVGEANAIKEAVEDAKSSAMVRHVKNPADDTKVLFPDPQLGVLMHNWHSGQGDPIYRVGSLIYAYDPVDKEDIEDAISNLESMMGDYSGEDLEELEYIIGELDAGIIFGTSEGIE